MHGLLLFMRCVYFLLFIKFVLTFELAANMFFSSHNLIRGKLSAVSLFYCSLDGVRCSMCYYTLLKDMR